jgi:hypothetical protein
MYHFFFNTYTTEHFYRKQNQVEIDKATTQLIAERGAKSTTSTSTATTDSCDKLKQQIDKGKLDIRKFDDRTDNNYATMVRKSISSKIDEYNSRCSSR